MHEGRGTCVDGRTGGPETGRQRSDTTGTRRLPKGFKVNGTLGEGPDGRLSLDLKGILFYSKQVFCNRLGEQDTVPDFDPSSHFYCPGGEKRPWVTRSVTVTRPY